MARLLNLFRRSRMAIVILPLATLVYATPVLAASAPSLGSAKSFAALAGTGALTCTGGAVVKGNVGAYPGTTVTGFPGGCSLTGTVHAGDATAKSARAALLAAYTKVAGMRCTQTVAGAAFTNVSLSYAPGVICFGAGATVTTVTTTVTATTRGTEARTSARLNSAGGTFDR